MAEVAAGGGRRWLAVYTGFPEAVGDEVDDALLGLKGPNDAEERGRVARRVSRNRFKTLA